MRPAWTKHGCNRSEKSPQTVHCTHLCMVCLAFHLVLSQNPRGWHATYSSEEESTPHVGFSSSVVQGRGTSATAHVDTGAHSHYHVSTHGRRTISNVHADRCWRWMNRYVSAMWLGPSMVSALSTPSPACGQQVQRSTLGSHASGRLVHRIGRPRCNETRCTVVQCSAAEILKPTGKPARSNSDEGRMLTTCHAGQLLAVGRRSCTVARPVTSLDASAVQTAQAGVSDGHIARMHPGNASHRPCGDSRRISAHL